MTGTLLVMIRETRAPRMGQTPLEKTGKEKSFQEEQSLKRRPEPDRRADGKLNQPLPRPTPLRCRCAARIEPQREKTKPNSPLQY